MYPNLSYLLHDLFGTPVDNAFSVVQMFGLLLGIAIFVAGWLLYLELKRKGDEGLLSPSLRKEIHGANASAWEIGGNALFGFFIGFKGVYLMQHLKEISDPLAFIPTLQGNWIWGIVLAAAFGLFRWYDAFRQRLPEPKEVMVKVWPHHRSGDIAIIAALTGLIGAKLFASFESAENIRLFFQDPIGTFFSGSGLAMYGGLAGGTIGILLYVRKHKIPVRVMMDCAAPALMIGYAVGRIGCQVSGDGDWGIPAGPMPSWWFFPDWAWAYDYPHNVSNFVDEQGRLHYGPNAMVIEGFEGKYNSYLHPKVYPTPLWESVVCFGIVGILWFLRKKIRIAGVLFFIMLIFNGVERFWIEKIRVNDKIHAFGITFTQAEFIAVLLIIIGIIGWTYLWLENKRKGNVIEAPMNDNIEESA